ncbi:MAG: NAD(P)-dependent oxidoreductase, partial [Ktedonobacteraceae bacterium]
MKLPVHVLNLPLGHSVEELQALLSPDITITTGSDVAADCEILVAGSLDREQLQASTALHALIVPWAGVPVPTRDLLVDFPHIAVHNIHHNALPVAEMAVTLMLAASKFIVSSDHTFRSNDWSPRFLQPDPALLITGKTVLIIGYGAIGKQVGRMCHGLGMHVQTIRRHLPATQPENKAAEAIAQYSPDALHNILPATDIVIICVPLTPETRGLLGTKELTMLPPHAILVNVSRAEIVDEAALYSALKDRTLYAAGLDVWYRNPSNESEAVGLAPSVYPFSELENVVISPHRAGHAP